MKTRLHHILITTCIASTALATTSFAQDTNVTELEVVDSEREKSEREKILYSPGEGDTKYIPRNTQPTTGKESKDAKESAKETDTKATTAPVKVKPENTSKTGDKHPQSKPNDDDTILSFNFLYFIIQKYKLQDIVD